MILPLPAKSVRHVRGGAIGIFDHEGWWFCLVW
jgi:hypothetical protein